ncbi:hypothetical protein BDV06DRAFT_156272 [Aspergillus oleicola]
MHLSKSYTLMALALAAGSASAHVSEEVEATGWSTTIQAPATSAPSKDVTKTATPHSTVTSVPEKIETVYASHTTWVTTTATVCEKSSCKEKHTSTPVVVPHLSPQPVTSQSVTSAHPSVQPSSIAKQPVSSIPFVKTSVPASKAHASSAPASEAPVSNALVSSAPAQSLAASSAPAASSARASSIPIIPIIPSSAPAASSTPLIKSTPAASKTVASSSAHKTSAHHKPTSTSSHEDNKEDEGGDVAPAPAPEPTDIINPGSKLIIPGLASLTGVALGLLYLA